MNDSLKIIKKLSKANNKKKRKKKKRKLSKKMSFVKMGRKMSRKNIGKNGKFQSLGVFGDRKSLGGFGVKIGEVEEVEEDVNSLSPLREVFKILHMSHKRFRIEVSSERLRAFILAYAMFRFEVEVKKKKGKK
jgi:hypothetical protein